MWLYVDNINRWNQNSIKITIIFKPGIDIYIIISRNIMRMLYK